MVKSTEPATPSDKLVLELRRGALVLATLSQLESERYGYSLVQRLAERGLAIEQGTLYPLLRRLDEQGLLDSDWKVEGPRPRKYYQLSKVEAMELIERYVNDVGRRLPKKQRDEVRRELRSALLDAVDSSEGAPTEETVVAALTRLGPPEAVAASYRPADSYLIGPELYPDFKRVLGIVTTVLLSLLVGVFAITLLSGGFESTELGNRLLGFIGSLFDVLWVNFAIVVLIFAGLQRLEVKPNRAQRKWDPRQLPAVRDVDVVGRGEMAFSIVAAGTFLALLHVFKGAIGIVVNAGGELLLNEVLIRYLPWASAVLVSSMALHAYLFWRGRWEWPTRIANFAIDVFGLAVLYRIVVAVAAEKASLAATLPEPVPTMIVRIAWTGLAVLAVIVAWETGKVALRSIRGS
jgi:DNA-binding PadR family transcriptional regulator